MNNVCIVARICKDLELKDVNGTALLNFTVACQRDYKNAEGKYDADFISVVAWRQQAVFISRYFKKSDKIAIIGSLTTRNYTDNTGKKIYIVEVYVKNAEFIEKKGTTEYTPSGTIDSKKDAEEGFYPVDEDLGNLPFDL